MGNIISAIFTFILTVNFIIWLPILVVALYGIAGESTWLPYTFIGFIIFYYLTRD